MQKIKLDFYDPDFIADPYPTYQLIQEKEPVYQDDSGVIYLTKYQDVVALLTNKNTSRRPPHHFKTLTQEQLRENDMDAFLMNWLIFQDPPKHTQMRQFFAKAINPKFIRARADTISALSEHLLQSLKKRDQFDIVSEFAGPLSLAVVCDLSGLPPHENQFIKLYSDTITQNLDTGSSDKVYSIQTLLPTLRQFFHDYLADYKNNPQSNFLSYVIENNALMEEPLNDTQIADATTFIVFSAHETTRLAISLSIYSLLRHPDQIELLKNHPNLITQAVEECLRYETPFNKLSRWTTAPVTINETEIPENTLVVPLLNAANRDPEIFDDPHRLNIKREQLNLAFGKGIHTCLGSVLGRLETEIALQQFIKILPEAKLVPNQTAWGNITSLRYITRLMIQNSQ
ncbi:MAG: cytochrome P450 [Gammaproteobacteria bacterium]|nr:cytochrome P450 [Gammaproteobacteria bacterium]